mmetsp:Transcript_28702/g.111988  ORF Transcript_28702/g.111988 Transcript_28702/m.111988 type:complete len:868 (-) Transcript_28702:205-2808(-)|eukprot:CAMPEP_0113962956 /NCGR_PEP_ID=MMETSP0011_2-20120614/6230_1 /TAXON_ID=101924 /ORGANISM="Rhodosorus marinus" /LENGTH=867 /DNA_ID=CAMNT_0000974921 /DNA_START=225 /DNA_END=2828 /DNA_ORIENTATION=+ /assembly_acc=CAM_ASM_000156
MESEESDLGSDEDWVPGGEVEVDQNYRLLADSLESSGSKLKLSNLFGGSRQESGEEDEDEARRQKRSVKDVDNVANSGKVPRESSKKERRKPSQSKQEASHGGVQVVSAESAEYIPPSSAVSTDDSPTRSPQPVTGIAFRKERSKKGRRVASSEQKNVKEKRRGSLDGGQDKVRVSDELPLDRPPPSPLANHLNEPTFLRAPTSDGLVRMGRVALGEDKAEVSAGALPLDTAELQAPSSSPTQRSGSYAYGDADQNNIPPTVEPPARSRSKGRARSEKSKGKLSAPAIGTQAWPSESMDHLNVRVSEDRARSGPNRSGSGLPGLNSLMGRSTMNTKAPGKDASSTASRQRSQSRSFRSEVSLDSEAGSSSQASTVSVVRSIGSDSVASTDFPDDHDVDYGGKFEVETQLRSQLTDDPEQSGASEPNLLPMNSAPLNSALSNSSPAVEMTPCSVAPNRTVIECIVDLLKGTRAQKQGTLKIFKQRWIWLGNDLSSVMWKSKKQEFGTLSLTKVSKLFSEGRELSFEDNAGRRIVFQLNSSEEIRIWLTGLSSLVPKKCRVKMDDQVLTSRLSYNPLMDSWRGNVVSKGRRVGNYIILGELGEQDRGYLILSPVEKSFFMMKAVKGLVSKPDAERAAILRKLMHPHVVLHKELFWDEKKRVAVCAEEYMSRGLVYDYRPGTENRALPEEVVLETMYDVMRGLYYLHSVPVAHGSLRPNCVYRSGDGNVKIAGLFVSEGGDSASHAFDFAAPEVESGVSGGSLAADVWSVGAIMYTMLFGKEPFKEATREESFRGKSTGRVRFPKDTNVSKRVRDLLEQLLKSEPGKRPSMGEILSNRWLPHHSLTGPVRPGKVEISQKDVEKAISTVYW